MTICKLCAVEAPKLSKSHIIPKSLYGNTIADPNAPPTILSSDPKVREKRSRVGVYDQELLCGSCEASFSDLDGYAHQVFMGTIAKRDIYDGAGVTHAVIIDNVDTAKLKTFFVTLLWRMHATAHPMFSAVNLGIIAKRVHDATRSLDGEAVPEIDIVIQKFDVDHGPFLSPTRLRIFGVNGYRICFSGYSCWVKVDQRPFPSAMQPVALTFQSNQVTILRSSFVDSPELRALVRLVVTNKCKRNSAPPFGRALLNLGTLRRSATNP
jgi:hypothetical protein